MPIRDEVRHHYGKDWKRRIRPAILTRAEVEHVGQEGQFRRVPRCECTGQCGAHPGERCVELDGEEAQTFNGAGRHKRGRIGQLDPCRVIITIAHLDQDPANMADGNLLAACQQCHNRIDAPFRHVNAWRTKRRRLREAQRNGGQIELFA